MENFQVLVYLDEGVDPVSFRLIVKGVRKALPDFFVRSINRAHFLLDDWESKTKLIIFPGGRDIPYHEALKGPCNARLRNFVEQGGRYLGICAGGYYGASSILFEEGGKLEVKDKRELGFFSGVAKGPIYGHDQFCYNSLKGARIAQVSWQKNASTRCISPIFFNGGCAFIGGEGKTLATYHDLEGDLAAAVCCDVGKGKALLTGVHPEYDAAAIPENLLLDFMPNAKERDALWHYFLTTVL